MPNKIKFSIKDPKTIVLEEDAKQKDYIDLTDTATVNFDFIYEQIEKNRQSVIDQKIKEITEQQAKNFNSQLETKTNEAHLKAKDEFNKKILELQLKNQELNNKLESLEENRKLLIENAVQKEKEKLQLETSEEIKKLAVEKNDLKNKLENLENSLNNVHKLNILEIENKNKESIAKLQSEISKLQSQNDALSRNKDTSNIKQLGEDLEAWCENEVLSHINSGGFVNAVFQKDNIAVASEDDPKATKGDFIFRVYADAEKKIEILSVCLDMKNKLTSTTKNKNEQWYKQLDSNRTKKKCQYALLVSELEIKADNYNLFTKVNEYDKMYMIRPAYLVFFLQIIYNLSINYADALINKHSEEIKFKNASEISEMFHRLKDNVLDAKIEKIIKSASVTIELSNKIIKHAENIKQNMESDILRSCETIKNAVDDLEIKKLLRKVEKLNDK